MFRVAEADEQQSVKDAQSRFLSQLAEDSASPDLVIPSFPDVTLRIRNLADHPDTTIQQLVAALAVEPVLAAQVLKLANSALYRQTGAPEQSLERAVQRVGMTAVRDMAVMFGMRQLALGASVAGYRDYLREVWAHSLLVAALARIIAAKVRMANAGAAQLAGLLHDIGKFYIVLRARDYPELFAHPENLKRIAGEWHAAIGRTLLESWDLPLSLQVVAEEHEDLGRDPTRLLPDLADVVGLANALVRDDLAHESELVATAAARRLNVTATLLQECRALAELDAAHTREAFPSF